MGMEKLLLVSDSRGVVGVYKNDELILAGHEISLIEILRALNFSADEVLCNDDAIWRLPENAMDL